MSRPARPWYRKSRGMWMVQLHGKQIPLGVTDPKAEVEAWAAYRAIANQPVTGVIRPVAAVVAEFLADKAATVNAHTLKVYGWYLSWWSARHGTESVHAQTAKALEAEVREQDWSDTTRNNYLATVGTCLRWAGVRLSFDKPPKRSAGAGLVIPEEVYRRMLMHCRGDWAAVIAFLWHTGARPSEARAVTVESVDWDQRVVRLREHKTQRLGEDRLIYFGPPALEVLTWQRDRYQSGLLFRSHTGGPLSRQAFAMKFHRLSKIVGRRVTAYGVRHSYATRALASGESDTVVAALLGHHGTAMLHKSYSHVSAMGRELRAAIDRIGGPRNVRPSDAATDGQDGPRRHAV